MIHQRPLGNSFSKGRFLYALALPKNKNKSAFILYCARLIVSLDSPKILTLDNKINPHLFCIVLAYSYLCNQFERITKKLGKKNEKRFLDSRHFMRLHDAMDNRLHRQRACVHGR